MKMQRKHWVGVTCLVGLVVLAIGMAYAAITMMADLPQEPLNEHAAAALENEYKGPYMSVKTLEDGRSQVTHHRPSGDRVEIWDGGHVTER